ncbi:multiple sugar transport system substrate-binding protein [Microbacteriaceae bacterium SG_E_30_P1]|uniref:Multiple sugar transport system substrate-binding protein n=1 Tax=Antiquaquibacter oligotrophicus TaxID=2880260 RepID=A0ABT6KRX4_9MICO|nr:extracellular solute-binding protein [Antiquaquibacter oligotrophicus]MDH6182606.1 multiple sugar transport system substrate-binding protein [Antiquaquibacter oligotrophicus]UDF14429.1 extracellular solute-binding protein [Antiquaquibacter oligotrophicus]
MITTSKGIRAASALVLGTALIGSLAACAPSSEGGGDSTTYTLWDPYPDRDASSTWAQAIDACADELGITIERNSGNTGDTVKDLTTAAGNLPDLAMVDNPKVGTLADAGLLTTNSETGLDTSAIEANILSAGELDGETYGVPVGANTLGLYYNPEILEAAGVDIASVTDYASLTAALEKVVASGAKGITFSAVGTEEGTFQFLPWFWGADADLTELDSSAAQSALQLWTDWVNKGLAPNSVLSNTQGTSWDEFMTGEYGFAENGSWFKGAADEAGYLSIQVPGIDGGAAPAPTGGEFITIPVQSDTSRYETSTKIVECLTTGNAGADALGYVAPTAEGQAAQLEADPSLEFWITAVGDAKPRTADNLGISYGIISEQLYTAVQNALSGVSSPADALADAQAAAAERLQ